MHAADRHDAQPDRKILDPDDADITECYERWLELMRRRDKANSKFQTDR